MAAIIIPKWGFIVFLVVVYAISSLMNLDPNIIASGGGGNANAILDAVTAPNILVFLGELALGITLGLFAGSWLGNWLGVTTAACVIFICTFFLNTWAMFLLLFNIATFGNLGLPFVLQWAIAIPCLLLATWILLGFLQAVTETYNGITRPN